MMKILALVLSSVVILSCRAAAGDSAVQATRVTAIGIAHTPCFGSCPVYEATITSDGIVHYKGIRFVERRGEHTGRIDAAKYAELAKLILDNHFTDLEGDYREQATDMPTVITTVEVDGKRKVVSDYGRGGPDKLREIERRIDALVSETKWDAPKDVTTQPSK